MTRAAVAWAAVALALAAVAFFAGRSLRGHGHEALAFDLKAPSYAPAPATAGLTKAGFSGLEDGSGIAGSPLMSGRVSSVAGSLLTLSTANGPATFRLSGDRDLRRIEAGSPSDLAAGASVIVILAPDGHEAQGVLVIPQP